MRQQTAASTCQSDGKSRITDCLENVLGIDMENFCVRALLAKDCQERILCIHQFNMNTNEFAILVWLSVYHYVAKV